MNHRHAADQHERQQHAQRVAELVEQLGPACTVAVDVDVGQPYELIRGGVGALAQQQRVREGCVVIGDEVLRAVTQRHQNRVGTHADRRDVGVVNVAQHRRRILLRMRPRGCIVTHLARNAAQRRRLRLGAMLDIPDAPTDQHRDQHRRSRDRNFACALFPKRIISRLHESFPKCGLEQALT
ncbi:hypothetical protein OKW26_000111 [Paraburkholderia sp. 32]